MLRPIIFSVIVSIVMVSGSSASTYLHQAVGQAQSLNLLPYHSVVEKTAPGIQLAYYNIGPYQRANLHGALGSSIPYEVLRSLEHQVDSIGKYHY